MVDDQTTTPPSEPRNAPLVSVVTPVYNGAAYIAECIESVLRQTYRNWDFTVVDNASTDGTPEIVERLERKDSRVRLRRFDELVPANDNHNRAFRAISAESAYCKVVQADDWLYPECLERMVAVAREAQSVGVVGAYRLWGDQVDLAGLPYQKTVISGRDVLAQSLLHRIRVTGAPTALMYRSRLVRERDPFWASEFEHADTEVAYWVLSRYDFGFVHQVLTFARKAQPGSRMTEWADEMNTYTPENIRFLLRYGPSVLDPHVYRRQLRRELQKYVSFHLRQVPKPSRLADPRFFALHHGEIDAILAESADDPEVRAAMTVVRAMLLRGRRGLRRCSAAPA